MDRKGIVNSILFHRYKGHEFLDAVEAPIIGHPWDHVDSSVDLGGGD